MERQKMLEDLAQFDNSNQEPTLEAHKYAEEALFKTCYVKKWQVDINPKRK